MHDESPQLGPLVGAYYERVPEESRLEVGAFRLEEARTRELVLRHAASLPARILDLGDAAGAYAFWLAERGYEAKQTLRISTSSSSHGWRKNFASARGAWSSSTIRTVNSTSPAVPRTMILSARSARSELEA